MKLIKMIALLILFLYPSIAWPYQITGTFIQLFKKVNYPKPPLDWDSNLWLKEIRYMKEIGIDTVIVQYAIYDDDAYYQSKFGKMVTKTNQIECILSACQNEGLNVYLGLILDSKWWKGVRNSSFLNQLKERSIAVAEELLSKYGRYNCIKGWYLPFEVEDRAWFKTEREEILVDFLKDTIKKLKKLTPGFQIIISPYFLGMIPPEELAFKWARLFKSVGIDIVAVQDGSGRKNYKISNENIYKYFKAFKEEFEKNNLKLWVDMEIYSQTKDWPNWDAEPTTIESIRDRLEILGPLVEKIICFEFTHYMSPNIGERQRKLYQIYRRLK